MSDYTQARNHFHTLSAAGWSLRAIAAHANVSSSDLSRFIRHHADVPHVAVRLMKVDPATLPSRTTPPAGRGAEPNVSRVGTVRRLRALQVMGWSAAEIGTRIGKPEAWVHNKLNQQGRWVRRSTHDLVAGVYRQLSHQRGPSEKVRGLALARGYAGPADWDDIDTDEAPAKPEHLCAADGCLSASSHALDPQHVGPSSAYCQPHRHLGSDVA